MELLEKQARRVELETDLEPRLPRIDGDADRLQQVFINLINNSIDAMPNGGVLSVRTGVTQPTSDVDPVGDSIPATRVEPTIFIELSDTGHGMSAELSAHIFEPFYTTKGEGHGTGLGLVVVRQVIREHRGEVQVTSDPGKGTRFRITVPVNHVGTEEEHSLVLATDS